MRNALVTAGLVVVWTLFVLTVVFAEAAWFATPAVTRGDAKSIENHFVRKLSDLIKSHQLGSAALVLVQSGKIVAEHGFGIANAETGAGVNPERTLYVSGSVSKAVTAWGVLRLAEEGRLDLDEPVMRHLKRWRFPGSEAYRDKVTARHLLSHTPGIDDGFSVRGFPPEEKAQTIEEWLADPKDASGNRHGVMVVREPGQTFSYSSASYTVLQLLIEEVTGKQFADYMRESVLQPLGMRNSSFDLDQIVAEGRSEDLSTSYDNSLRVHPHRRYTAQAAVSLRTTPRDLARFVTAYTQANAVQSQKSLQEMSTPQPGTGGSWGLGQTLFVENGSGGYVVGHDGGAFPALGAQFRVNPATGNGMVLLISGGRGQTNQLAHDWVYWETGKITFEARRQVAMNRLSRALMAIIVGSIAIVTFQSLRRRQQTASEAAGSTAR